MPVIRSFLSHEWRTYKNLRLRALADSPDAFGRTLVQEKTARTPNSQPAWHRVSRPPGSPVSCGARYGVNRLGVGPNRTLESRCRQPLSDVGRAELQRPQCRADAAGIGYRLGKRREHVLSRLKCHLWRQSGAAPVHARRLPGCRRARAAPPGIGTTGAADATRAEDGCLN